MSILFLSGVRFLSRAAALTVSFISQPRIYRLAFKSEDSEDELATNRSKASIPNANSREAILNLYLGLGRRPGFAWPLLEPSTCTRF